MKVDPNHDIVPTLRLFDGLMTNRAADEIEALRTRMAELEDLLTSARAICERRGDLTAWERLDARIEKFGIGKITAKTFRVLPSDILGGWIASGDNDERDPKGPTKEIIESLIERVKWLHGEGVPIGSTLYTDLIEALRAVAKSNTLTRSHERPINSGRHG